MAVQDWFDEARFGLFVHWGHYARSGWEASWPMVGGSVVLPEGQSMNVEIYHANARGWVPDMGAPERWVAAAAAAGMRYAVLTTRHHDGYSLWPSKFGEHGVSATAPGVLRPGAGPGRDQDYCSRLSTFCGTELAWASIAVPACCRICARVSVAVS